MRLTFNNRTAWFGFDTGAGAHTLASWFVDAAGMAIDDSLVAGVRALDAVGAPVELRAVHEETGRLPDGNSLFSGVGESSPIFRLSSGRRTWAACSVLSC